MKRFGLWVLAAALLLSLVSCREKLEPSAYGEGDFDITGDVELTTEYPVYDRDVTAYTYCVVNHTDQTVFFGQQYSIEMFSQGEWKELPLLANVGGDDIGYEAAPGESVSNAFSFWPYDFAVVDGTYRLIKSVTLGTGEERLLCREFSVGDGGSGGSQAYVPLEELPEEIDLESFACDAATDAVGTLLAGSGERVAAFLDKAAQGTPATLRTVNLTREGDPVLCDVVYGDGCFLYRVDATRDRHAESEAETAGIYEQRYSYLVTDGEYLYLSDYASLDYAASSSRHLEAGSTVILCLGNFENGESLSERVERMTRQRLADNSTMARYWSEDGAYWVDLTAEWDSFSVSTRGYGVGRTLPAEAGEGAQIYTAQWISPERVQLLYTTREGKTYRAVYDVSSEQVVFIEERG